MRKTDLSIKAGNADMDWQTVQSSAGTNKGKTAM